MTKRLAFLSLVLILSVGCVGPFRSDPVTDAGDPSEKGSLRAEELANTDKWFRTIETIRLAVKSAKIFADAAFDAGKISDVEKRAIYAIGENVKKALKVANAELTLYFQDSTTEESVVAKVADVNRSAAQLDALVRGLKSRQVYEGDGIGDANPVEAVTTEDLK